jgi:hypothetical protein
MDAQDYWVPGFSEWSEGPIDQAEPARSTLWQQKLEEAQKALTRFARGIDDYIYTVED